MGKLLALDIGEKRIGIAHSDDTGTFVFPFVTVSVDEEVENKLHKLINDEKPEGIVVGLPRNMDGSLGFQADKVRDFVDKYLGNYKKSIEYEDETVTTLEAEKLMKLEGKDPKKDRYMIDAYAAKIILESYLRRKH